MFKNKPPVCDFFANPYICWDKFWSISSTEKFMIQWKSHEKMMSIDIGYVDGGYVEIEKKRKMRANLEANSWRLMVSILHWGVIFQNHHMIEKIWWWGMITNGWTSPNNLYFEAKNQNISRYEGDIYNITFPYITKRYFVFWLILRDDNAVLVSLSTKKMYIEQLRMLTYLLFYLQNILNSHSIQW